MSTPIIPRQEYPRPQFVRDNWINLNGMWQFLFDFANSGRERKLFHTDYFLQEDVREILIPFCPESRLSGIGYTDFIPAVWYRRTIELSASCLTGHTILHFGAVDYHAVVWINGQQTGEHYGGYASFSLDVTELLHPGENEIIVYAEDDIRSGLQPSGKQSVSYCSQGCAYTRTTGIWQTVWMEFLPEEYIRHVKITPFVQEKQVLINLETHGGHTATAFCH